MATGDPGSNSTSALLDLLGYAPGDTAWLGILPADGKFTNRAVVAQHADIVVREQTLAGNSVYLMVNRSAADPKRSGRGDATAVTQLMALYADIDVKPKGMPTWESAGELIDRLTQVLGVPPAAIVNSGHGLQPYWPLDNELVTDQDQGAEDFITTKDAMRLTERWGALVRIQAQLLGGNVDSVFDLPRVLRAPGSVNYKNPEHVIPVTLHVTGEQRPYTLRQLTDVLEEWAVPETDVVDLSTKIAELATWATGAGVDCEWFDARVDDLTRATPHGRHPWMLGAAIELTACIRYGCVSVGHGMAGIARVGEHFAELVVSGGQKRGLAPNEIPSMIQYAIRFVEALTDEQIHQQVGYHVHQLPEDGSPFGTGGAETSSQEVAPPAHVLLDDFAYAAKIDPTGDAGIAHAVTEALTGRYMLTPQGNPLRWDGHHWAEDRLGRFEADFQAVVSQYVRSLYSRRLVDPAAAAKMTKAAAAGGGEKLLKRWNRLVVDPVLLNARPLDLCTPGGIVELQTGRVRPAEPLIDLNTQITRFAPEIGVPRRWLAFLEQMIVDPERIEYLQRVFGAALVGDQRWPDLPILVGKGNNGKSVILSVLGQTLGGYSVALPEGFLVSKSGTVHPTELTDLRGARLATLSEVDPHGKFNESRLKALTGGDPIRARKMKQDFEEFMPTHMFLLALNHLLQVASGGDSLFRRLRLITFDVQIAPADVNVNLTNELLEEGGQILSWLIAGARRALEVGLVPPRRVSDDTLRYRYEEDHVANFAAELLTPKPGGRIAREELMRVYTRWCRLNVQEPLPGPQFFRELPAKIDLEPAPADSPRHFVYGVALTADIDAEKTGFVQPGADWQALAAGEKD